MKTFGSAVPAPGMILALPPQLRVGPLGSVVDFVFGAATQPEQLMPTTRQDVADVVNQLPSDIGDDLKANESLNKRACDGVTRWVTTSQGKAARARTVGVA